MYTAGEEWVHVNLGLAGAGRSSISHVRKRRNPRTHGRHVRSPRLSGLRFQEAVFQAATVEPLRPEDADLIGGLEASSRGIVDY